MTRKIALVSSVVGLSLLTAACNAGSSGGAGSSSASGSGSGASGPSGESVTIGLVAEPASLDFTKNDGAAIPQVELGNIYETLVKQDQSGKIVPGLAEKWDRLARPEDLHLRPAAGRHLHRRSEAHRRRRRVGRSTR